MGSFNNLNFVAWSFIRLEFVPMVCSTFLGLISLDSLMQDFLACGGVQ